MSAGDLTQAKIRFGAFELDLRSGEIRRFGLLLRLPPQPFKVLALLAAHPNEIVTREELRREIWGDETFVDFEHGLNFAVKKIRDALGDDANTPRYIETLPRRGYRFIAPIEGAVASPPRPNPIRRIAVLPFANATSDPANEYLSDGLTDGLIGALSQLPDLRVMAHSTVFRYKRTHKLPQRIGQELQVSAVLTGRLTQHAGEIRIQADLVDTADGTELWGSRYARPMADITQLQGEITRDICNRLQIRLRGKGEERLGRAGTPNSEAYRLYLEGRQLWYGRTTDGLKKSIDLFRQAIVADPHYALAYAGLADSYSVAPSYHIGLTVRQCHVLAGEASRKAVELDGSLAETHLARATWLSSEWRWVEAEAEYRRALELNPNSAAAHYFYAFMFLVAQNRIDEALDEFRAAMSLDPLSPIVNTNYAAALMAARRYPESHAQFQKALELDPGLEAAHLKLSFLHAATGNFAEAVAELQRYSPAPGSWSLDARGYNELLLLTVPKQVDWQAYAALSFALRGESDATFDYLEKACSDQDGNLLSAIRFPALDSMRSDPRYADLMRRLGLPE